MIDGLAQAKAAAGGDRFWQRDGADVGLTADSPLARLLRAPMRAGVVCWIGLRPGRREKLVPVACAEFDPDDGLHSDHYRGGTNQGRQVTLIQTEHIVAIAAYLGIEGIEPDRLRRNIVVSGVNLLALNGQRFRVGSAELLATGACHPCSRMEEVFGVGGYNAVRGHGGITARVLRAGRACLGDAVVRINGNDDGPN